MSYVLKTGSYFGTCCNAFSCSHAVLTRVTHAQARRLPDHAHERSYVSMLISGSYSERIRGMEFDYRPLDAVFHPLATSHSDAIGEGGATFLCAELLFDDGDCETDQAKLRPLALSAGSTMLMVSLYRHALQGTLCPSIIESATLELIGDLAEPAGARPRRFPAWMHDCLECIDAEYATSITVKGLAKRIGVHPVHLAREFRRRVGKTLGEYLNKIRIRAACRQVLGGDATLAEIATASGFYDQSHFVRVFRAAVGCPPSAFRRSHRWGKTPVPRL